MARVTLGTGESITVGGDTEIFGTSGAQNVTILDGSTVTFRSGFNSGGDTIRLNGTASDFVVSFSGSNVTLTSVTDGITIVIPIGVVANTIVFDNGDTRTLSLVNGVPTLGGQAIPNIQNAAPAPVTAGAGTYTVEGSSGTEGENVTFTVTRTDTTSAETLNFTVQGDTANGTLPAATLGADVSVLSPNSGTVVFAAGAATATITVRLSADTAVEGLEGYKVVILDGTDVVAETAAVIIDNNEGGQVFNLTSGVDRVGTGTLLDIVGSAGNTNTDGQDTIVADTGTLNPFDVIDGGDDTDTLIVLDEVGFLNPAPSFAFTDIENVEVLNYSSASRGFSGNAFNTTLPVTTDVGLRPNWEGLEQANIAINGGPAQTVTLRTETALNIRQAGDGDLTINGGGGVLNVIAADFAEEANTGDVVVGATNASNEWTEINVRGGFDIDIIDQGAQELTTVTLVDINDDFDITGGVVANVSLMGIDPDGPGSTGRTGTIDSDVAVTVGLSEIANVELDLNSTGPALTVNADGATISLLSDSDIVSDGTLVINSTSGTFVFDDARAGSSVTLNAVSGAISLDDVDSDTGVVNISGVGSVFIDTVLEVAQTSGTVITSTNSGGVFINDQLDNNTKFIGTDSSGDDTVTFGATDRANSFGAGNDEVFFNADAFGNDAGVDGDNGAFDGGADYDRLFMESNDANTFTASAKAVTNFEELVLTGQDIGKADVIDLHNIGMDTISNVTSNVGNTTPEFEEVTINFAGLASGPSGIGNADTLTFDGETISFTDGDDATAIANAFLLQYAGPNWNATAGANPGEVILTAVAPGFVTDLTAADFVFTDATSIGAVGFEQGAGAPVTLDDGNAPVPGVVEVRTLNLNFAQVLAGQTITITEDINGGFIPAPDPVFTFTAAADLTHVGGELATFFVAAWNDPANTLNARWTASVSGNNVVFTATSVGDQDPFTLFNNPTGNFTVGGTGLTAPADTFSIDNATVAGADPIPGDTENVTFTFDGVATGNDQIIFDGVTITLQDGDTATAIANAFEAQYNAAPVLDRNWVVTASPAGTIVLESLAQDNLPNLSAADFQFIDDTNVGTPSVGVAVTNQGSSPSVTLNNFISGSTLTLNAALGTHFVNMKTDTTADVLNLVLANLGDHGYVEGDDVETLNIDTAGNTPSLDKVDFGGGDLTTIVVTGSNGLQLDTSSTIVSSVDASALGGAFIWDAGFNEVNIVVRTGSGGSDVDFTQMAIPGGNASAGTAPITFIGGSGNDVVTTGDLGTSRGTITTGGGFDDIFVGIVDGGNDFWSITDFSAANDELDFAAASTFLGRDQELEPTAIFQDYLDQAARGNTADGNFVAGGVRYFWYDEDGDGDIDATYVVQDNSDSEDFVDGSDTVIRLEGQITLTADNFI
jgi:hypothetical protein